MKLAFIGRKYNLYSTGTSNMVCSPTRSPLAVSKVVHPALRQIEAMDID